MRDDILLKIRPLLAGHLNMGGFVLVDMRFYKNREGQLILEVLVDRIDGGIILDECTRLNRELGGIIDSSLLISGAYYLDISSPGLDRSLATVADFRRVIGREVRFFLKEMVDGKIEQAGTIESLRGDAVLVRQKSKTITIPLNKVNKARQVIL